MPKINFGIADAADVAASQGYDVYKGELPPNGAYRAEVKVVKVGKIASGDSKGKSRLQITAIIKDPEYPEYDGCPAFGNLNLTEQGAPYVNQFLESLTDGSDKAKTAIKNGFWKTGPIVDDAKEHILRIGKTQVNSPKGTLTVVVGTKQNTYQGNTTVRIQQWMVDEEGSGGGSSEPAEVVEVVEVEEDSDIEPEEDDDADTEGEEEDPYGE